MNLLHIYEGWTKSLGIVKATDKEKQLAMERIKICIACPFAEENWLSKIVKGVLQKDEIGSGIGCSICGCPINEISYVLEKKCPKDKW